MTPKIIQAPRELAKTEVRKLRGLYLGREHYDAVIGGDQDIVVFTAKGRWLLTYSYSPRLAAESNRLLDLYLAIEGDVKGRGSAVFKGAVLPALRKDGTTSRCDRMVDLSGLERSRSVNIGFEAGNGRNPYAHPTKFVRTHPEIVARFQPHIQIVDQEFARVASSAHWDQFEAALRIPDWTYPETSITSWIVNNYWRTAGHLDRRMFGPSVMTAIIGGAIKADSGRLVFPQHRVAVEMRTGALLIANTAGELHGNDQILAVPGKDWWRVTLVGYLRPQLLKCGTRAEEEEKRQRFLRELKEWEARKRSS